MFHCTFRDQNPYCFCDCSNCKAYRERVEELNDGYPTDCTVCKVHFMGWRQYHDSQWLELLWERYCCNGLCVKCQIEDLLEKAERVEKAEEEARDTDAYDGLYVKCQIEDLLGKAEEGDSDSTD